MYIYENPEWPHFTFDNEIVSTCEKREFRLRCFLEGILSVLTDRRLREVDVLSASLASSWAIEGINLSERDVYSSIVRRLGLPYHAERTSAYYDNVSDVLLDAVENHDDLTLERLLSWHRKIVEINPGVKRGCFRSDAVYVISGGYKNREVIYEAPPAHEVPRMMEDFISFINSGMYSDALMSGIAQLYLVEIHPFEDGNGRVARLVSDYVLSKHSRTLPGVLISSQIKKKQKDYYKILDKTSKGNMDITEWCIWYLERLIEAEEDAIRTLQHSFAVKAFFDRAECMGLNDRERKMLGKVLSSDWVGAITAKKYAAICSCHPDTANRDLKKLVEKGLITKEGEGRSTRYHVVLDISG